MRAGVTGQADAWGEERERKKRAALNRRVIRGYAPAFRPEHSTGRLLLLEQPPHLCEVHLDLLEQLTVERDVWSRHRRVDPLGVSDETTAPPAAAVASFCTLACAPRITSRAST